jgi:hypothetical protein
MSTSTHRIGLMGPMTVLRSIAAVALAACGGTQTPQQTVFTFEDEVIVAERPEPAFPPVAEPLGLAPPPPPLPAFGGRALFPSDALIDGWHRVVRAPIDHPAPLPPASMTMDAVQRWSEREFAQWIRARREAVTAAETVLNGLAEGPPHERGIAAALVSRLYDDFLHDLTGNIAIPAEVANDPDLLRIYSDAVHTTSTQLLERAADTAAYCARTFEGAPDGWWTPWAEYCRARSAVLARAPRQVAVVVIAERMQTWSPPREAEPALTPIVALAAPAPRAIPRALREDVTALDALVLGQIALEAGTDAGAHWTTFATYTRGPARAWPEGMTAALTAIADVVAPAAPPAGPVDPRARVLEGQIDGVAHALTIQDRARRCWAARSLLLGVLAADHAQLGADRQREERRIGLDRQRHVARRQARLEAARALGASQLEGDALVQAALPLSFSDREVDDAAAESMRVALRAYVSQDGEGDPAAVRAAAAGLASGNLPEPVYAVGPTQAQLAEVRVIFEALGQGPDRGARALTAARLDDEDGAISASHVDTERWRVFAQACR